MNRISWFKVVVLSVVLSFGVVNLAFAGSIVIKGSTTVLPIAQKAAEDFMRINAGINISVSGGGSGNGIKAIIDGTTDIADSSRFIKDKEIKLAMEKGVLPVPHRVAMDCVVPVVHPANPLKDISMDRLKDICDLFRQVAISPPFLSAIRAKPKTKSSCLRLELEMRAYSPPLPLTSSISRAAF
jgi:ABC-type phosphate transport system substrate-binding protein